MEPLAILASALAVVFAGLAAHWDVRHRTIPNWLCLATGACGLLLAAIPFDANQWLMHTAHLLAALAIGMGLFALHWWGGGDAKFYAAVAGWFPLAGFFQLIFWISIAGLVLVLGDLARRKGKLLARARAANALPYGVAIAAGMIATVVNRIILLS